METIRTLKTRHRLIMYALATGVSTDEVCASYDITPQHLSQLRRSPLWQREEKALLSEIKDQHKRRLLRLADTAIDTIEESMKHGYVARISEAGYEKPVLNPPSTRSGVAQDVLDRLGLGVRGGSEGDRSIVINLYQPGWANEDGEGRVIEVESEVNPKE